MTFHRGDVVMVSSILLRNSRVPMMGKVLDVPTSNTILVKITETGQVETFIDYEVTLVENAQDAEIEKLRKEVKELRERVDELTKPKPIIQEKARFETVRVDPKDIKVHDLIHERGVWHQVNSVVTTVSYKGVSVKVETSGGRSFMFLNTTSKLSVRRKIEKPKDIYKKVSDVRIGDVLYYLSKNQYTEVASITRTYRNGVVEYYLKGKDNIHSWVLYGDSLVLVKEEAK